MKEFRLELLLEVNTLSSEFNFGLYQSNTTIALHEVQI